MLCLRGNNNFVFPLFFLFLLLVLHFHFLVSSLIKPGFSCPFSPLFLKEWIILTQVSEVSSVRNKDLLAGRTGFE